MAPHGLLDVSTGWLKVVEWNATQIIATDDSSICLTSQTIFDLKRKTVIALDIRKPEAQGLEGACNFIPDRQTYYLQDKADYFAQKIATGKCRKAIRRGLQTSVCGRRESLHRRSGR
jgi:hypothetical protein